MASLHENDDETSDSMPQITLSGEQFCRLVRHLQQSPSTPVRSESADSISNEASNSMPQITLSVEQFRRLVQHLQNSPSTPTRLELADSSSETSEPTSEDIESSNSDKVSTVPKRPGPFGVIFDPDIHDVFSFTSCLGYLQPRPKNISKYLRGDAVGWYADLSAAVKAGINTCVGLWCHELEEEYRETAGQSPVPQIPLQKAPKVHQQPLSDKSPELVFSQPARKSRTDHPKQCRSCKQRFVSGNQLFNHLQTCRYRGKLRDIAPCKEPHSEEVSITSTSGSVVNTHKQSHVDSNPAEPGMETEQLCPSYQSNSHISKPNQCRLCKQCFASGNQLHHHLQVSHFQAISDDGTSPPTLDRERIVTTLPTPEATLDAQEQGRNVTTPVVGANHSSFNAFATTQNLWRTAAGARISTSMETKPLSTKSPPYSSTSIPTQCRICNEKFASKSKLHQHLKAAHRFRNPEEREFQRSLLGRPITAH